MGTDGRSGGRGAAPGVPTGQGLTYDVLTRGFYDRLGYRTVGILENCPAGTATRWYRKDL